MAKRRIADFSVLLEYAVLSDLPLRAIEMADANEP